jgi:very-short-patch-repair endonuclease
MGRSTTKATVGKAKALRATMTLPEVMLWQRLRAAPVKFRRQHPVGPYVVDFYCPSRKLVIEIDGLAHDMGDRPTRDLARTADLEGRGYRVLRIPASDVLADCDSVADGLIRLCQ